MQAWQHHCLFPSLDPKKTDNQEPTKLTPKWAIKTRLAGQHQHWYTEQRPVSLLSPLQAWCRLAGDAGSSPWRRYQDCQLWALSETVRLGRAASETRSSQPLARARITHQGSWSMCWRFHRTSPLSPGLRRSGAKCTNGGHHQQPTAPQQLTDCRSSSRHQRRSNWE